MDPTIYANAIVGGQTIVSKNNLKSGNTSSCGCKRYERRSEDLTGKRFGRLCVVDFDHMGGGGRSYWRCICDCGNETLVSRTHLLVGHVTSCGCWNKESHTTHGMSDTSLHHIWTSMKQRCDNTRSGAYAQYGGRG